MAAHFLLILSHIHLTIAIEMLSLLKQLTSLFIFVLIPNCKPNRGNAFITLGGGATRVVEVTL